MTAALWASEPLPPWWPSSMYFLALSHAPPALLQVVGHQLADEDDRGQEGAERLPADAEADDHRGEHGEQRRRGELAQRRRGADVDDRAVVGLLLAAHDLAVGELVADLLHHDAGRAADGADGERREQERHGAADQQADEDLRLGDVDRELRQPGSRRPSGLGDDAELASRRSR